MHALHARRKQVYDLVDGVGDARFHQRGGVVVKARDHARDLGGDLAARKADDAVYVPLFDQGHDARLHGHADARQRQHVAEAEKVVVVEKQLGVQMRHARVHLLFQAADIRHKVGRFGVAFGVAGGGQVKIVPAAADIAHQVCGVAEGLALLRPLDAVAAQGQNVAHAPLVQLQKRLVYLVLFGIDAGQMRQRLHPARLDELRDLGRARIARTARAAGHRNIVGRKFCQRLDGAAHGADVRRGLGRKDLERPNRLFLRE